MEQHSKFLLLGLMSSVFMALGCQQDLDEFDTLKSPQISFMSPKQMLTTAMEGAPSEVSSQAIPRLFKAYFKIRKVIPGLTPQVTLRARWTSNDTSSHRKLTGEFGIPLPDTVTTLPGGVENLGEVSVKTWQYGEVVSILHTGSYDSEDTTVAKLKSFIETQNYEIYGKHEEEYLKGPGMFFRGNPDKYITIIRYRVRKIESPS